MKRYLFPILFIVAPALGGYVFAQQNVGGAIEQIVNTFNPASVALTGGTINGVTIGGTTPAAGTFTTLTATGGTINGVTIGGTTPAPGTFTTLTSTAGTINGATIGGTTPGSGAFTSLSSNSGVTKAQAVAAAGHSTNTMSCTATGNNCYTQYLMQPAGASWQLSVAGSGASALPGGAYMYDGTNVRFAMDAAGSTGFGIGNSTAAITSDPWYVIG
jgi:hypothetical protein